MTGQATGIVKCETYELDPAFHNGFLMAADTWYRQVASREGVIGFLMLLDRKFGRRKTGYRVTFLAGALARARRELRVMIVAMTILAKIEFHLLERFAGQMALVAGDRRVLAKERKTRLAMVKSDSVDTLPAGSVVASLAIPAEFVVVGILMTI